jgi:uncharacterized protein YkwD
MPARTYRPNFELLERRDVPSSARLSAGVLTVLGTSGNNAINLSMSGGKIRAVDSGASLGQFPATSVKKIVVDVGMGNDRVTITTAFRRPTFLYGGKGDDVLTGGSGKDTIYGGDGADTLKGRGGNDTLWGGARIDSLSGGGGTSNVLQQDGPSRAYVMNALELEVLALVNQQRALAGLSALTPNVTLAAAAHFHSSQMAARSNALGNPADAMQHDLFGVTAPTPQSRLDYAGYDAWRTYGENIAYGYTSAAAVMAAWMNSPGHRANILNPNFTELGVGVVVNAQGQRFWTQVFGDQ